jgi:large subunit ribosomal protein L22
MVNEALAMLKATPKAASTIVYKVIASATANAEHNQNLAREDLYVAEIFADGGPILKRVNPVSKGRAYRINKRTSHITVILDTKEAK